MVCAICVWVVYCRARLGVVFLRGHYAGLAIFTLVCISWYRRQLITIISNLVPSKKQISRIRLFNDSSISKMIMRNQSHRGMQPNMRCQQQQQQLSVCNRSCALGVVAVRARKIFNLDYVGTSSTNAYAEPIAMIITRLTS